jgi:hypothetical protein
MTPITPVHSPHPSASSIRSRTPGQLSLHDYRKQQVTPSPSAIPGQKSIKRKSAASSLRNYERLQPEFPQTVLNLPHHISSTPPLTPSLDPPTLLHFPPTNFHYDDFGTPPELAHLLSSDLDPSPPLSPSSPNTTSASDLLLPAEHFTLSAAQQPPQDFLSFPWKRPESASRPLPRGEFWKGEFDSQRYVDFFSASTTPHQSPHPSQRSSIRERRDQRAPRPAPEHLDLETGTRFGSKRYVDLFDVRESLYQQCPSQSTTPVEHLVTRAAGESSQSRHAAREPLRSFSVLEPEGSYALPFPDPAESNNPLRRESKAQER